MISEDRLRTSPTLEARIRSDLADLLVDLRGRCETAADLFRVEYLEREIFSKYVDPGLAAGADERKAAAIRKWQRMELRNADTNVRLYCDETAFPFKKRRLTTRRILQVARATVLRVLGERPPLSVLQGMHTGGASTQHKRGAGVTAKKFMDEAHATADAASWALLSRDVYARGASSIRDDARNKPFAVEIVPGSVLFTVPKTSEIDRCACKEPGLNMYLQKGAGSFIRSRLRSELRQDLDDQTVNQRLARQGSVTRKLATLDLSSASDLISHQVVFALLPSDWFTFLDAIRSKECLVNDEWVDLNMFSSMGNAFTFELETLIFWSLVNAVAYLCKVRGVISVYGDDIVCPSTIGGLVDRVFAWFGFKLNAKKSFWRGPFRESCGKHWYAGVDVTPFYIKEPIQSIPRLIHFLNSFRNWSDLGGWADPACIAFWAKYAELVPRVWRGGRDCSSLGQLVTDESPLRRLIPVTDGFRLDQCGAYLHWLRVSENRTTSCGVDWGWSLSPAPSGRAGAFGPLRVQITEAVITSTDKVATKSWKDIPVSETEKYWNQVAPGFYPGWPMTPAKSQVRLNSGGVV